MKVQMKSCAKIFISPIEAAKAWTPEAVELTLKSNREYSSFIIKTKRGYKLTKPRRGAHGNVIFNALFGCPLNLFAEVYFIHTHTLCACHISDKFSGNPSRPIREPGDFSVVKVLKYAGIFLVSPDGRIFELLKNEKISDVHELRNIDPTASVKLSLKTDNEDLNG